MAEAKDSIRHHSIPLEVLDDLGSRFIINVPEDQRKDMIRMCFQIEVAHWFYIDEYVSNEEVANSYKPKLKHCWLREFTAHMFNHIGFLRYHGENVDGILEEFKAYKLAVPTYGAIILSEDLSKVLLVLGYWSRTSWGFPKGKVNEEEAPHLCAVREVLEETGYDISDKIDPDECIAREISGQKCCLYMIQGVPEDTVFFPKTKKEIRDITWFPVAALPSQKGHEDASETDSLKALGVTRNNLFMVIPFVAGIRRWIASRRNSKPDGVCRQNCDDAKLPCKDTGPALCETFMPKTWSNFRVRKKELLAALESTPGWIN